MTMLRSCRMRHEDQGSRYALDGVEATHVSMGVARGFDENYGVDREFRESQLFQATPIRANPIPDHAAAHVLSPPKGA